MLIRKNKRIEEEEGLQMTAMIDIVFQLLIFFLLSMKFVALEGQLSSYLPKDKGLTQVPQTLDLVNVILDLVWEERAGVQRVVCLTMDYRDPARDGEKEEVHAWGDWQVTDPSGFLRYGPGKGHFVEFEYSVPNFQEIEEYLSYRKRTYSDPRGTGLPVTVNFDDRVPVQVVTTLLDICTRLKITDFTLAARELPID